MTTKKRQGALRAAAVETLRRFAANCRALAYECAEGTAPPLIAFDFGAPGRPHCAMGEALARSVARGDPWEAFDKIRFVTDPLLSGRYIPEDERVTQILIEANNEAEPEQRHAAVVFPLLLVADASDRCLHMLAARQRPQKKSRQKPSEQKP